MLRLPDLVRDSKLETRSTQDGETIHVFQNPSRHRGATDTERWRYKGLIGSGGGGVVTLEEKVSGSTSTSPTSRAVKAIKVHEPRKAKSSNHQSIAEEYVRELEALAKFSQRKYSSCFVQFYGWWERTQRPQFLLIAMEYCPLGDLDSYVSSNGPVPVDEAQEIAAQVLDGLCYMHEEGFAHRDLKPANILIKSHPPARWWVVICDHGLSKRIEDNPAVTTVLRGTPMFMPPERHGFHEDIVPRKADPYALDMWCLGETTFQLLCNEPTFGSEDILRQYAGGVVDFPTDPLRKVKADEQAIDFVTSIMLSHPARRLTCFQARQHVWMKVADKQQSRNSTDHTRQEQALAVRIPALQPTAASGIVTESSMSWSTVSQASHHTVTKEPASIIPNFEASPDFSLRDIPTSNPTVKSAAIEPAGSTATITQVNRTTRNSEDRNGKTLVNTNQVKKDVETTNKSPSPSSKANDGSPAARRPEEKAAQNPEKKPQSAPKRRWNRKMLRQLFGMRNSNEDILNQPSPSRSLPSTFNSTVHAPPGYEVVPGGRIARMAHWEEAADKAKLVGDVEGAKSEAAVENAKMSAAKMPPADTPDPTQQESEQLPFFKDYYSQDDIRPGSKVAVLWAYQPRANDEFALERGDMIHVVAVWDDGWGVGAWLDERAENWELQRDSGNSLKPSLREGAELKAFPLVCVCLPQHWRETIEGKPPPA